MWGCAAPVRLCMIDEEKQASSLDVNVSVSTFSLVLLRQIILNGVSKI